MEDGDLSRVMKRFERRKQRFSEFGVLNLEEYQLYAPDPLRSEASFVSARNPFIDKFTGVASMGSCFAREIGRYLDDNNFTYLRTGDGPGAGHGSARWERVYNAKCIAQEIRRCLGEFVGELIHGPDGAVIDPHRKGIRYKNLEAAKSDITLYIDETRELLGAADVLIVTLGMSEMWRNISSGHAYAEFLPNGFFNPELHEFHLASPDENATCLIEAFELLQSANSKIRVILTVSPIPLRLTFMPRSAMVSNAVSKASLLWAAGVVSERLDFVHYFPSYEIVTSNPTSSFDWDGRHVRPDVIAEVMRHFEYAFCGNV